MPAPILRRPPPVPLNTPLIVAKSAPVLVLSRTLIVRTKAPRSMALRKSTEDSAEVELNAKFWTPPVPTKPPLPQVNAVGLEVPPKATTKGVEWAAKPTPPVVLAME